LAAARPCFTLIGGIVAGGGGEEGKGGGNPGTTVMISPKGTHRGRKQPPLLLQSLFSRILFD